MKTYQIYVRAIRKVTKMKVPVKFNSPEANYSGGAYAGFSGYEDIIAPDLCYNPALSAMFEVEDFLQPKHLKYYHIGLPDQIYEKNDYVDTIMKEVLKSIGVPFSIEAVEAFVILHEFGHAHYLFCKCKGNIRNYLATRKEREKAIYRLRQSNLSSLEIQRKYRKIAAEKYADDFAKKYIHKVLRIINSAKKPA